MFSCAICDQPHCWALSLKQCCFAPLGNVDFVNCMIVCLTQFGNGTFLSVVWLFVLHCECIYLSCFHVVTSNLILCHVMSFSWSDFYAFQSDAWHFLSYFGVSVNIVKCSLFSGMSLNLLSFLIHLLLQNQETWFFPKTDCPNLAARNQNWRRNYGKSCRSVEIINEADILKGRRLGFGLCNL